MCPLAVLRGMAWREAVKWREAVRPRLLLGCQPPGAVVNLHVHASTPLSLWLPSQRSPLLPHPTAFLLTCVVEFSCTLPPYGIPPALAWQVVLWAAPPLVLLSPTRMT